MTRQGTAKWIVFYMHLIISNLTWYQNIRYLYFNINEATVSTCPSRVGGERRRRVQLQNHSCVHTNTHNALFTSFIEEWYHMFCMANGQLEHVSIYLARRIDTDDGGNFLQKRLLRTSWWHLLETVCMASLLGPERLTFWWTLAHTIMIEVMTRVTSWGDSIAFREMTHLVGCWRFSIINFPFSDGWHIYIVICKLRVPTSSDKKKPILSTTVNGEYVMTTNRILQIKHSIATSSLASANHFFISLVRAATTTDNY